MAFRPTLVAPKRNAAAAPFLGFEVTEIALVQPNNENAGIPSLPSPDDRSDIIEGVTGADVKFSKNKKRSIEFDIDYLNESTWQEIQRLYHDDREVYICPNYNAKTMTSLPLQGDLTDVTGNKTWVCARAGTIWKWDAEDEVMRSWASNDAAFPFHGHWLRYWSGDLLQDNHVGTNHPSSTGTGWSIVAGAGSNFYSNVIETPVLSRRGSSTTSGVAVLAGTTGTIARITTNSTLDSTRSVGVSLLIQSEALVFVKLLTTTGTTLDTYLHEGGRKWNLVRLSYNNAAALSVFRVEISFLTSDRSLCYVASCTVDNAQAGTPTPQSAPDYYNSTSAVSEVVQTSSGPELYAPALTFSFFMKYTEEDTGIFDEYLTAPGIAIRKRDVSGGDKFEVWAPQSGAATQIVNIPNFGSTFGLSEGDWCHVVVRLRPGAEVSVWVNGKSFGAAGIQGFSADLGATWRLGNVFGASGTRRSGISHFRIDRYLWTDQEVIDHYDTYFAAPGKAMIQPVFGRLGHIVDMSIDGARSGGNNNEWQFTGSIEWEELTVEPWAGIRRQEGDV